MNFLSHCLSRRSVHGLMSNAATFARRKILCFVFPKRGYNLLELPTVRGREIDHPPLHVVLLSGVRLICMLPKVSLKILSTNKAAKEYRYPGDDNKYYGMISCLEQY